MTVIAIEDVQELQRKLAKINKLDFQDIEWTSNGVPLVITDEDKEDWRFTGLSNTCFVESNEYGEFISQE